MSNQPEIWTIGHSTHSLDDLIAMLKSYRIELLVDVRSYPGSRKWPQFNKDALQKSMPEYGIDYVHILKLGGRRRVSPDSKNIAWHHSAFRAYADYMETEDFLTGIHELMMLASEKRTAYMCSEAVWWRCHRSLISDYLKIRGWKVLHIMGVGKETEHPYTSAAQIIDGQLHYDLPRKAISKSS